MIWFIILFQANLGNMDTKSEQWKMIGGNMALIQVYEPVREKTNNLGFEQVQHKPACSVTGDGKILEILDLESR